jgi:hypothetical protein
MNVEASLAVDAIFPVLATQVTVESKLPVPSTAAVHWLLIPSVMVVGLQETAMEVMVGGPTSVTGNTPDFVGS